MKEPVLTTLATTLPETMPKKALEMTAILAGPPGELPERARAESVMKSPVPLLTRKAPSSTKAKTTVAEVPMGSPKTPSVVVYM